MFVGVVALHCVVFYYCEISNPLYNCCFIIIIIKNIILAPYPILQSLIICDLLGVEKLPGALGIVLFVQGIANIMGPPIAGKFLLSQSSHCINFLLVLSIVKYMLECTVAYLCITLIICVGS